jgi:penicillin-binding protein 2
MFAVRIKAADWKDLTSNPDKPLLNRAIQAQLAPGSTFKPIVAIAGLQDGTIDEQFSVRCGGGAGFYGRYFKCWQKGGHGTLSLHRGIAQSCDVYFYTVGNKVGIDKIAFYAGTFGLGRRTGIDLPHETEGVVPSTRWKARNFRQKWYPGETISVAIGQGALTVSPLQLAAAEGGMAQGGVWHRPHLMKDTKLPPPNRWELTPEHVQAVVNGMYAVVNEGGTGGRARIPGIEVCGKTGTSQLASLQFLQGKSAAHLKDNAWFIGFAPRHNPEIIVTALFENGEHGHLAGPIVRDVIKAYFDKKARTVSQRRPKPPVIALGPPIPRPLSSDSRPINSAP